MEGIFRYTNLPSDSGIAIAFLNFWKASFGIPSRGVILHTILTIFLTRYSCVLILCYAFGKRPLLFPIGFGFRCYIFRYLLKYFPDSQI